MKRRFIITVLLGWIFINNYSQPCSSIINMTLGTTYNGTLGTTGNDWTYYSSCSWDMIGDEQVYQFTPTVTGSYTITATDISGEPDFFLMSSCSNTSTNYIGSCWDNGSVTVYLYSGTTYYIIVDNYYNTSIAQYSLVINTASAGPSNDECSGAINLTVNATCSYSTYTNAGASATLGPPHPGCANYLGGDVWFKATVPASGHITIDTKEGVMTDGGMAIYTGTCSSLTLVECDDDDSPNGLMPQIDRTGLTPGSTIYIRVWEYGNNNNGTFQICAYDVGIGACGAITNIANCGTTVTVNSGSGFSNWNYQVCGAGTPGRENIFSYTPTISGPHYIQVNSAAGSMTYGYKTAPCEATGWTCIARISSPGVYGPLNWTAGTTYYILIDDDDNSAGTHQFYIRCPETPGNYFHPTQGQQNTYLGACMVNTCTGVYQDDGGSGNYSNNINRIYRTFCPDAPGKCVRATFTMMNIEGTASGCYDYLIVRNGPTQGSSILWAGCRTMATPTNINGTFSSSFTASTQSGCLTFQFYSDASYNYSGWNITLSCVDCAASPTNNDCISATSICGTTNMNASSPGPGITSTCGGCNLSENFSNWYRFEITTSGRLYLDVKPEEFFEDYDFALYRASNCANLGDPVRCSYAEAPSYCYNNAWWNGCSPSRYISNVTFNTINNATPSSGYADYKNLSTSVNKGSTYTLSVTVAGGNQNNIKAWFDWNKNLIFTDAGEEYTIASNVAAGTYSVNITIPAGARVGKTGFRVVNRRTSTPVACHPASCIDGEIEDYAVYITDGTHCSNNIKDADETGVDCGGVDCVPCSANYWPTNTGMNNIETDFSEDVNGNSWVQGIPVTAGETYYLMINNWSPNANGFDLVFNFTDGGSMNCEILPINLLSFDATLLNNNKVMLSWTTASEVNNDYFTILKSTDAVIYKPIAQIKGAGNSNDIINYEFIDEESITQQTYYRIKQTDYDGNTSYSEVRVVSPNQMEFMQNVNVQYNDEGEIVITIIGIPDATVNYYISDMLGKVLFQDKIVIDSDAISSFRIQKNNMQSGVYQLFITSNGKKFVKKFVVTN
ncbi:MAG: GEVED domain-containing protein [Bacteroidales bacterium]|nr:GEVED domain-containing protein [Bacteroidales bacterium]